jgi:hypothetical protein
MLYICVYLARRVDHVPTTPVDQAFVQAQSWPYDVGDDPSFFAAAHLGGPLAWGVCRPDVRNAVRSGDWVAFIAAQDADAGARIYRFAALLQVERKVPQNALFTDPHLAPYQQYLNLLIRPSGTGWEHHEPALPTKHWHQDWLWRLSDRTSSKKEVAAATAAFRPGTLLPVAPAANYVLFSQSIGVVAKEPPVIADHQRGAMHEVWRKDQTSQSLGQHLLGGLKRGLRTGNRQQPHRHIRRPLGASAEEWMRNVIAIVPQDRPGPLGTASPLGAAGRTC